MNKEEKIEILKELIATREHFIKTDNPQSIAAKAQQWLSELDSEGAGWNEIKLPTMIENEIVSETVVVSFNSGERNCFYNYFDNTWHYDKSGLQVKGIPLKWRTIQPPVKK